jgi:hypothetical protein
MTVAAQNGQQDDRLSSILDHRSLRVRMPRESERFKEIRVVGQGQFGQTLLVEDRADGNRPKRHIIPIERRRQPIEERPHVLSVRVWSMLTVWARRTARDNGKMPVRRPADGNPAIAHDRKPV